MNQILKEKKQNLNNYKENIEKKSNKNIIKQFKMILTLCLTILIISLSLYFYHMYILNKKEKISKKLIDSYNVMSLYSDKTSYTTTRDIIKDNQFGSKNVYVIGLLEINTINLSYPILSDVTDEYLKISPCRFYGPLPNEVGNLCIAGHNYKNYKFFSRINELKTNDIISIQDLSGNRINYSVYDKYDINSNELDCTRQDTNSIREVTLVTCNSINNNRRIVIKAKETR